jgi:phage terminase large subunit-like protein
MNKEAQANGEYTKHYTFSKQFGLERVKILGENGGTCDFRTRSGKGGLGEGFDLLIIDEAQEYTDEQQSALKYVVTDSRNPQTILCGTPPTAVSSGTVFPDLRENTLQRKTKNTGWAEWSVAEQSDPQDKKLWYRTNPSLNTIFTERSIEDEITGDDLDFNIQRLGLWVKENLKSAISKNEWAAMRAKKLPEFLNHDMYVGVKFGKDGTNAAMAIAIRTKQKKVFVEVIDCKPIRDGIDWLVDWIAQAQNVQKVAIDGANGQNLLSEKMKNAKLKKPVLPTVKEIINANAEFEQAVYNKTLVHMGQEELANVVSNCDKRNIGSNGGFGYAAQKPDAEIALMDSVILAHWLACTAKERKKPKIKY